MLNNESIESASNEHDTFKEQASTDIESIEAKTQLKLTMNDITESKACPCSIDFTWS